MDRNSMLTKFVEVTGCETGLAADLLAGKQWNWAAAMSDYQQLTGNVPASLATHPAPAPVKPSQSSATRAAQGTTHHAPAQPATTTQRASPAPQVVWSGSMTPSAVTSSVSNPSVAGSSGSASSSLSSGVVNNVTSSQNSTQPKLSLAPDDKDGPAKSPVPTKKLQRGISKANCALVDLSRRQVTEDKKEHTHHLVDTPMYTFILPDLALFPAEFRTFMEKDLLEVTTMANLETAGRLNWWAEGNTCSRLWPMATTGDGNCLLHAASLGMWGFHDRQLTLRKALYHALTENPRSPHMQRLKRRWRWQQTETNQKCGLVYSEPEWEAEWKSTLRLASAEPRTPQPGSSKSPLPTLSEEKPPTPTDNGEELTYESLEEFHVFVLAHILRRPIIIVSDTMLRDADGEAFAPISFGGIYLPVEVAHRDCETSPLVLTYDTAHFSALVPMEQELEDYDRQTRKSNPLPVVIPITDCDHKLLPVHFAVDPGPNWQWGNANKTGSQADKSLSVADTLKLLHQYLALVKIPVRTRSIEDASSEQEGQQSLVTSANDPKSQGNRPKPLEVEKGDKGRGSFGKKLKHFAKLEKHKNGGVFAGDRHVPLSERKIGPISLADLEDPTIIVGSKMSERRHRLQEEMIKNYIDKAKERFEEERKLKRILKEENRQQDQLTTSRVSPSRTWNEPVVNSRGFNHEYPMSQGLARPEHGYQNRKPSPEVYRRYNQQQTHQVYQLPTRGELTTQAPLTQPQYHQPLLTSLAGAQPAGYQYGYQLDAPAESTVLVNQLNVQPQRRANPGPEKRTVGQLVQGIHELQPTSIYQQTPSQSGEQPSRSPQIARSAKVISQQPHQSTSASSLSPPVLQPGSRSPQAPLSPRPHATPAPPPQQLSRPASTPAQPAKSKDPKGNRGKLNDRRSKPCMTKGCDFYGTESTNYLCSHCYEAKIKNSKPNRK